MQFQIRRIPLRYKIVFGAALLIFINFKFSQPSELNWVKVSVTLLFMLYCFTAKLSFEDAGSDAQNSAKIQNSFRSSPVDIHLLQVFSAK